MKRNAYAKINLGLDVVRKREDGYHEVRMIMHRIDLYDVLDFTVQTEPGIVLTTNRQDLPTDEGNLVYRAAKLLMDEFQVAGGVKIHLEKQIPVAAGMAGGSSDAAAAMMGINELFRLGLSKEELMNRAVKIGADVPYCILGGTALAEGIGEVLTPLPSMKKCPILIAKPPIDVPTKFVYGNLRANELTDHPDIDGMISALKEQNISRMCDLMGNVLETVTIPAYPVIEEIKTIMKDCGATGAMMSGSGPTVFGIFESPEDAKKAEDAVRKSALAKEIFLLV